MTGDNYVFFFQAEDGIRGLYVTGVQTCALPISVRTLEAWSRGAFQSLFGVPPPRLSEETPPLVARLKRHPALYEALRRRPHVAGRPAPGWSRLRAELAELMSDRGFLAAVVAAARGELPTKIG